MRYLIITLVCLCGLSACVAPSSIEAGTQATAR